MADTIEDLKDLRRKVGNLEWSMLGLSKKVAELEKRVAAVEKAEKPQASLRA